jgi:hypothetical protein
MNCSDQIALALEAALDTASLESREALRDALNTFAKTRKQSFADVRRQPFAAKMIDAMSMATEF